MTSYTATAFKWSGTYYNATYTTSHSVTFTDDDGCYNGGRDGDETISIDGSPPTATISASYSIKCDYWDAEGNHETGTFQFFYVDGAWYFIPDADTEFTEGCKLGSYKSHTCDWEYSSIVCLTHGTRVATAAGPLAVEHLEPGTLVRTADGRTEPLRLKLERQISALDMVLHPGLRPVLIGAGALGGGLPRRDLWVSRQHRMLVRSAIVRRMFGQNEVLVAAVHLTSLPGIRVVRPDTPVTYVHLVFDRHEVILAEGAPTESLYPGPGALRALSPAARAEFRALFPAHLAPAPSPAGLIPPGTRQKRLISRHLRNRRDLVATAW